VNGDSCRTVLGKAWLASAASMASSSGAAAADVGATAAITVERKPATARLLELGVRSWPK
jgi:hypothetical protein